MPDGAGPLMRVSTAPNEAANLLPPESTKVPEWPPSLLVIERIGAHLPSRWAIGGGGSPFWMGGTLVGLGPWGPRMVPGARGLGSNVGGWLGPPLRKMKIHDGSRRVVPEAAAGWPRQASAS